MLERLNNRLKVALADFVVASWLYVAAVAQVTDEHPKSPSRTINRTLMRRQTNENDVFQQRKSFNSLRL